MPDSASSTITAQFKGLIQIDMYLEYQVSLDNEFVNDYTLNVWIPDSDLATKFRNKELRVEVSATLYHGSDKHICDFGVLTCYDSTLKSDAWVFNNKTYIKTIWKIQIKDKSNQILGSQILTNEHTTDRLTLDPYSDPNEYNFIFEYQGMKYLFAYSQDEPL